jgi:integrase
MSNTTPFGYPIPPARRVSPLRQRMIEDMTVRNFAPNTQESYLSQVSLFARHFGKSPEQLGPEEIRAYQIYLAEEKKASVSTRIVAVSALRFFYAITLQRDWSIQFIPAPKKEYRLPVILSPQEVFQVLQAAPSFTHQVIFSCMYGTGMRVSEAVHLRAANIDSQRMMIRIELSKGHKDRDVQLSPKLLELLRCYWRKVRPGEWMFPGQNPDQPLTPRRGRRSRRSDQPAYWPEEGHKSPFFSTRIRCPFAGSWDRRTPHSTSAGPPQSIDHGSLSSPGHDYSLRHHQPLRSAASAHR